MEDSLGLGECDGRDFRTKSGTGFALNGLPNASRSSSIFLRSSCTLRLMTLLSPPKRESNENGFVAVVLGLCMDLG